jgi:hypothetical protein
MNELSGNAIDVAGGFTAVVNGTTEVADGVVDRSRHMGYSGQSYFDAGDINELDGISAFTLACWAKFDSLGDYHCLIGKSGSAGGFTDRIIMSLGGIAVGDNTCGSVSLGNGANSYGYTATGLISTGVWGHWTAVFDGSQSGNSDRLKFYFNSIQRTLTFVSTIPATTASTSYPLVIGEDQSGLGRYLRGYIDEVRIYTRSLSPTEISQLYTFGKKKLNNSGIRPRPFAPGLAR